MSLVVSSIQIVLSILLMTLVLIQSKGVGLGRSFGGGEIYHTRRGAERIIFVITIFVGCGFVISSLLNVLVS